MKKIVVSLFTVVLLGFSFFSYNNSVYAAEEQQAAIDKMIAFPHH